MKCALCGVTVPENARLQHERGRKHNGMRFWGDPNATVGPIRRTLADGANQVLRPFDVSDAVVACARRARSIVLPSIVSHSGVAHFHQVVDRFAPERLCGVLLDLEERRQASRGAGLPHAATLAMPEATDAHVVCAAALLSGPADAFFARPRELSIQTRPRSGPAPGDLVGGAGMAEEAGLSTALALLADQLPRLSPGSCVHINLRDALTQRRHVAALVEHLATALRAATGIAELRLSAWHGRLRAEDEVRLRDAAAAGWRARVLTVLAGARGGGGGGGGGASVADGATDARRALDGSPLAMLTPDLLRYILEMVRRGGRARVAVHSPTESAVNEASVNAPPRSHPGSDLAAIAMLID